MALRDRLERRDLAIPAIPAIPSAPRPSESPRIAKIATIAAPETERRREQVATPTTATPQQSAELRALLARHLGADSPDFADALAAALASPEVHLRGLRASMPERPTWDEWSALMQNPDFVGLMDGSR